MNQFQFKHAFENLSCRLCSEAAKIPYDPSHNICRITGTLCLMVFHFHGDSPVIKELYDNNKDDVLDKFST